MGVTGIHTTKTALPAAPEMERGLLSILIQNPEGYFTISSRLSSKHFYRDDNRAVFAAISGLLEDQRTVDALTVLERMEQNGDAPQDAVMLLMDFQTENTRALHLSTYAEKVIENWQRRELMRKALETARAATDPTLPIADTLSDLTTALDQVSGLEATTATLGEQLQALKDSGERIYKNGDALLGPAIFDIPTLDKAMDGAHAEEVCIVSGGTGEGKSSLFNTAQKRMIELGVPFYDWSGEMSTKRRHSRLIAALTGINSRAIFKGLYFDSERFPGAFEQVIRAMDQIEASPAVYEDGAMTLSRAVTTISYLHRVKGIKVFFFDRKELFDLSGIDAKGEDAVAYFMNRLRRLAKDLGIQLFIAGQLRKEYVKNAGSKPTKADVIGTSATMQAATQVLLVYSPEKYGIHEDEYGNSLSGKSYLILDKNTNGERVEVLTRFTPELALFSTDKKTVNNGENPKTDLAANYGTANQMQAATNLQDNETIPF
jgi:replicative DNA helicase